MLVARKSPITGRINSMQIDVTKEQLIRVAEGDGLIQDIVPHLTPAEREFILTGYTDEDWKKMFPPEEAA